MGLDYGFNSTGEPQKKNLKAQKPSSKNLSYKIANDPVLGNHVVATKNIKADEIILQEAPLVFGPAQQSAPVCLACFIPVDGSYKCPRSGWPLCGPTCAKAVQKNPEVVVPTQCEATFEIEEYFKINYMYECIIVLRALLLQKQAPAKWKKLMSLESHFEERKGTESWTRTQENIIDVMKKTLGIMVFEALCPEFDFSDDTIQKIQGILETNKKEIRLTQSDCEALYATACLLEHSCQPNVKITFEKDLSITVRAGRDISEGEHISTMYTHAMWGTVARRDHLFNTKKFWCTCNRCCDVTEFESNLSTIYDSGHVMLPSDPLNTDCDWSCEKTGVTRPAEEVKEQLAKIGMELEELAMKGNVDDSENFIEKYSSLLHPNHYHMVACKHQLMQMYGRTEGFLIQDMDESQLKRKEELCREHIKVLSQIDPHFIRLMIFAAAAYFELHMPLLQMSKRKWEAGKVSTEEFRAELQEPYAHVKKAVDLLKNETNDALPEGQLRLQAVDTLAQLEGFMKTVGCQM